jgi:glycosyltransferase involved in cell wall biosynthesis
MTIQRDILRAFDPKKYDTLIYSLDPRTVTTLPLIAKAKRHGIPAIGWGHGIRPRGRFAKIYKAMSDASAALLLYTGAGKRGLEELGVDPQKMFVAWNSIDVATIQKLRSTAPLSERNGILYLGRMIPEKKVPLLVRGFAKALPGLGPDAFLCLVGKGSDRAGAEETVRQEGIEDRVTFVDETYQEEEIALQMNRCWVSVSPGYVGLSAIHAFAYGLPMIAGNPEPHSPEIEAFVEGQNGLFFKADDPDSLGNALITLRSDKGRLERFGANARETGDGFSVEAMVTAFENAVAYAHGKGPAAV